MKTTVLGIRLNEYQREKLKKIAGDKLEADLVRDMINDLIDGKTYPCVNLKGMKKAADDRNVSLQVLLNAVAEQLNESSRTKTK